MSRPYTDHDLSSILDADLIWRRKELSDMKAAIKAADPPSKSALMRAIIAMSYAHWEDLSERAQIGILSILRCEGSRLLSSNGRFT